MKRFLMIGSCCCLVGSLIPVSAALGADEPVEIRFILGHADCNGYYGLPKATVEYLINGNSVGTFETTQECECNSNPMILSLSDETTLSFIGSRNCTLVTMLMEDPAAHVALAYARVEIERTETGTETLCIVDYSGGDCGDRNICPYYEFPGTIELSNALSDMDGDGDPDCSDPDIDGDGVANEDDNCATSPNPDQSDADGDGVGDACEAYAICVPWVPSAPEIAHYTYSGAEITLKGIARGGAMQYRWDFGDGDSTTWTSITDPYNLGIKHVYNGVDGQEFQAVLFVRGDAGNESQDNYPVKIYTSTDLSNRDHLDVRINMAIDEGLWWLHTHMIRNTYGSGGRGHGQPYGYWDPDYYPLGAVGTAVDAFQLHGSRPNTDYDNDPYVETVQRGLNYLLNLVEYFPIGVQPAGDPDWNGNGIGLVANHSSYLYDSRQTYLGGICMAALASSRAPNRIAQVGGDYVYERTYGEIVQDMAEFFAYGQVDSGSGRGGWRYYANYSGSDMSTTQWPPLAMLAAEQNMGTVVPEFVRDELPYFLDYTQHTACDNNHGGFGYSIDMDMPNCTKAAAGIICHEFLHLTPSETPEEAEAKQIALAADPKVQGAIGFLFRHWNDTGASWDYTQLHGNSYGMYGVMKAMRIPQPDFERVTEYDCSASTQTENSFDWYYTPAGQANQGLASYIVGDQQSDGSWDDSIGPNTVYNAFCTGWRLLVLLKGVTIIPPVAIVCDCDEQEYNLNQDIHIDGSCSYHPDKARTIVLYEWDFDYDGTFEPDSVGEQATLAGGYSEAGFYPVALRVTDDNPGYLGGPQTDMYICEINVHAPPHCPHAFADGPYDGWIGIPLTLDASASWDPDNEIVSYEWDLDSDGLFGTEDEDCFGEPSDAVGVNAEWTWHEPYDGVIGLRVTDAEGEFASCSDIDYSMVDIGNHEPVSVPGGPYNAPPDSCITLDGSASFDIDPEDVISFAWDLDNDGEFDDGDTSQVEFCVASEIGRVYDLCLKVTDSFGEYDIKCTTVEIVPNMPPICDEAYASLDQLWPPNNKMVSVNILGVTDPDDDPVSIVITGITSDEATATAVGAGGPKHAPDAAGVGTDTAELRAERSGDGNGRVYVISFTATDSNNAECSGSVTVCVPHDQDDDGECVDDGQAYDATEVN